MCHGTSIGNFRTGRKFRYRIQLAVHFNWVLKIKAQLKLQMENLPKSDFVQLNFAPHRKLYYIRRAREPPAPCSHLFAIRNKIRP